MCLNMSGRQGKRKKQLSKDTDVALFRTCNGIVELTKNLLLQEDYEYVCLGEFSTDVLEKPFGKLRQGSGGSYCITAQQVTEKLRIKQAKLLFFCIVTCTSQLKLLNTNVVIVTMFWTPMLQLLLIHFLILKALSVKKWKQI